MKHITAIEKSLLVGDDAADTIARYAAHLARLGSGDTVELRAIGVDGNEVTATFLLNSGTALTVESTESNVPEPDNADAVAYMVAQMSQFDLTADAFDQSELSDES